MISLQQPSGVAQTLVRSPLWRIAVETARKTVAARISLAHAHLLPKPMRSFLEKQILGVAATME